MRTRFGQAKWVRAAAAVAVVVGLTVSGVVAVKAAGTGSDQTHKLSVKYPDASDFLRRISPELRALGRGPDPVPSLARSGGC